MGRLQVFSAEVLTDNYRKTCPAAAVVVTVTTVSVIKSIKSVVRVAAPERVLTPRS